MAMCPYLVFLPSGVRICTANGRARIAYLWCETSEFGKCKAFKRQMKRFEEVSE